MILPLKSFEIDINSFNSLVKSIPGTDGIVVDENITIVEVTQLSEENKQIIMDYYNNLNELDESFKINYPKLLSEKITEIKLNMVNKTYDQMNTIERKIFLNVSLTKEEEQSLWQ